MEVEPIWSTTSTSSGGNDAALDGEVVQRAADFVGVEEVGGGGQPVAQAAHAFQRQPGRLGLLQELRNAGAGEPHRRGEVFAGVEGAVGKLPQQRES